MAYQCAKKITHLVLETDAFMAGPNSSSSNSGNSDSATNSPTKNQTIPGTNQPMPPIMSALLELQNDPYNRQGFQILAIYFSIVFFLILQ